MPRWLLIITALGVGYAIWRIGIASIRSLVPDPEADVAPDEPEDVDELDVYLVCGECGTEYKVSRLGELQVPRHCGERMQVVRRSAGA
jgi:rubredoxin